MQDLKHLSSKKRLFGFGFSRTSSSNRRLTASGENAPKGVHPPPRGKRREQLKHLLLFLAIVLALTPVCVLVFQKAPLAFRDVEALLRSHLTPSTPKAEAARLPSAGSFETACLLLDSANTSGERLTAQTAGNETIHYTIHADLQQRVHDFLARYQVPYGVFVAIEPATGRILGMTAYSSADPSWARGACFDLYPMASLFKIITASAALETKRITPETVVEFRGRPYSENPRYWDASPRGGNNRMDVTCAMAKSVNPVYGRVASAIAGKASLMELVQRFGFNQTLLSNTPAKASRAGAPRDDHGLKLMGAGLDHEVKISPLHAAVIMSAIANNGRMMSPSLTDRVVDTSGGVKPAPGPRELRRLVSPETATALTRMLSNTVTSGTSRRAFHDRRGRPRLNVDIAAKTGSIDGSDPKGHYSWFAAFAPIRQPRIALVALVINGDRWRIKAPQVGEQALEEFFRR
ncbi:MAG TPA: penicillin-binding transpeptidase domain-containing protein [Desulfuromonadaceae bacterium]